jgi:CDP-diacylglycerol--serine O-phosphatidyltransferase
VKKTIPLKRKGIYILPNLFTLCGLFSGFYAIIASQAGHFSLSAMAIFVAMLFDTLDGRVARLIKAQSAFGAELDSLIDMVSFGVATMLVMFNYALIHLSHFHLGKLGWVVAFVYVACVAIRLARFNISAPDKRYFQGIPCPAAAAVLMSFVWVANLYHFQGVWVYVVCAVLTVCLGLIQVSNIPYRSFKDINMTRRIKVTGLIVLIVLIALLAIRPAEVLLTVFGLYALSGVYFSAYRLVRRAVMRVSKRG